jgi:pimeloyl-ACP methyl ester carboxylesterase
VPPAGGVGSLGRRMLDDVAFARTSFAVGFEHPERLSAEDFRTWLEPLFATPEATRNLERFIASFDNRQTIVIEPLLRELQAPTLIVWATSDVFFPVKWAYWLPFREPAKSSSWMARSYSFRGRDRRSSPACC